MTSTHNRRDVPEAIERRAELLAVADPERVRECADRCLAEHGEPTVIEPPTTGIVMLQVREPVVSERFHLGEVVVTRADVSLAGHRGWAMRTGTDRVTTLAAAICDAGARSGGEVATIVDALVDETDRERRRRERELVSALRPTVVAFEELD